MREPTFTQSIVRINNRVHIILVDAHRDAHEHVLRTLHNFAFNLEEVASLERFKSEVIVVEIPVVNDLGIEEFSVLSDDFNDVPRNQRCIITGDGIHVVMQIFHGLCERFLRGLVKIAHGNTASETGVVWVCYCVGSRHFGS